MKYLLFTLLFVLSNFSLLSQINWNIEWVQNYGGTSSDILNEVIQTSDDGYVAIGFSQSNNVDVNTNNGVSGIWLMKLNSGGQIIWQTNFATNNTINGYRVKETMDNGFVIVGKNKIHKVDSNGGLLWTASMNMLGGIEARDVLEANDGNLYVFGKANSNSGAGYTNFWLAKLNPQGTLIWSKDYGHTDAIQEGIEFQMTSDGGFILGGSGSGVLPSHTYGMEDYYVMKLDSNGDIEWENHYGGTWHDFFSNIIISSEGGYLLAGSTMSEDIDINNSYYGADFWVVKIDDYGNIEWSKTVGSDGDDFLTDVIQHVDGSYILCGEGSAGGDFPSSITQSDAVLAYVDQSGNIVQIQNYGGGLSEGASSITKLEDGYIVGITSQSSDNDIPNNYGGWDYVLLKISACPNDYAGNNKLVGVPNFSSSTWGNGDYETNGIIESTQNITNGITIDYDSKTLIHLLNGFQTDATVDFSAFIDGCNYGNGGILLQGESEENSSNK